VDSVGSGEDGDVDPVVDDHGDPIPGAALAHIVDPLEEVPVVGLRLPDLHQIDAGVEDLIKHDQGMDLTEATGQQEVDACLMEALAGSFRR